MRTDIVNGHSQKTIGRLLRPGRFAAEPVQQGGHFSNFNAMVDRHVSECAFRHAGTLRIVRVLGDGEPATAFNLHESCGAVGQVSAQDDTDHSPTMGECSRPEQRIDGRPRKVLSRCPRRAQPVIFDQHVIIRRRKKDASLLDGLAVAGV
jgi:hypothetical protein